MSNRSPSGEPFRLAWDNLGRIYVEWLDRKGSQNGEPTNITTEFWALARRNIQEHGITRRTQTSPALVTSHLIITETSKKAGLRQAFQITVQQIAVEEDEP